MRFLLTAGLISLVASSASADWPGWAQHFNQVNRVFGIGWSDGYHACRGEHRPLGADLPPTPAWLQQRWANPYAGYGMADAYPAGTPTAVEHHRRAEPSRDLQQPVRPPAPPVPPSILEEIQLENATGSTETARSEEQAAYDDFMKAARNAIPGG